jgi:hypothetical protein
MCKKENALYAENIFVRMEKRKINKNKPMTVKKEGEMMKTIQHKF